MSLSLGFSRLLKSLHRWLGSSDSNQNIAIWGIDSNGNIVDELSFDNSGNLVLNGAPLGDPSNGTPGGSNTQVQYRISAVAFGGITGATTNGTTLTLVAPILGTPASGNLSNCTADGTNAVGAKNIPQNSQSANYTTLLTDAGKHLLHPATDNNPRTFTIDSNANVAFPIGTRLIFINLVNTLTIAITADTMTLLPGGTTGSRTLAANNTATAIKVGTTNWVISGTSGLT